MKKIVQEPKWSGGHAVLVRPGGDRRLKKIVREPKWSKSKRDRARERKTETKDIASEESKAKEKESVETGRTNV